MSGKRRSRFFRALKSVLWDFAAQFSVYGLYVVGYPACFLEGDFPPGPDAAQDWPLEPERWDWTDDALWAEFDRHNH